MTNSPVNISGNIFNARDLRSGDVARRFVVPSIFPTLLEDFHCVLEGPRGSGKTTLLRMLTPEVFALWRQLNSAPELGFIGVFVPADVRWSRQLQARVEKIKDAGARAMLMESAFSVATSSALLETIEACTNPRSEFRASNPQTFFSLPRSVESDIARALALLWRLEIDVPSIGALKMGLRRRQHAVGDAAGLLSAGKQPVEVLERSPFLMSSWLDNLVTATESINDLTGRRDQRWGILLDELEIIPREITSTIVSALRSTSSTLKFKLALSPTGADLVTNSDEAAPTPGNDYRPIQLWYERREDARAFAEKLFVSAVERFEPDFGGSLSHALGPNLVGGTISDDGSEDIVTNAAQRFRAEAFKSLAAKDESFRDLLNRKGINASDPPISDSSPNGSFVRKITPLVCLRDRELDSFSSAGGAKRKGGRKGLDAYFGYPNLIDLTEGNPRWVLTLADYLVAHARQRSQPLSAQGVQTAAVNDFVEQFVSKLIVYPTGSEAHGRGWTLKRFLDMLGSALNEAIYDRGFTGDPALSFRVDHRSLTQYGDYIRLCVDLGALVLLRAGSSAPLSDAAGGKRLEDARVRLSYRLAPVYRLPLRSTKERTLRSALLGGDLLGANQPVLNAAREQSPSTGSAEGSEPTQRSLL